MPTDDQAWKRCSTCKHGIGFRAPYFACSVSTCNRKGTHFAFCSIGCWDAHLPLLRHRNAWADEKTSPTIEEWAREQAAEEARTTGPAAGSPDPSGSTTPDPQGAPRDVLVVVAKLKLYLKATSGMNTSDDVADLLSDRLRLMCDDAAERARSDGRKTVMARDFRRQG